MHTFLMGVDSKPFKKRSYISLALKQQLCVVKINDRVSQQFAIERYMRQERVLSTFYYLTYADDLLKEQGTVSLTFP